MMDRLSPLPCDVLAEILSRLPSKCAVRTCVLSRRFLDLWKLVRNIRLDGSLFPTGTTSTNFYKFASSLIMGIVEDPQRSIDQFRIVQTTHNAPLFSNSDLRVWLNIALQRRVKNVEIYLNHLCPAVRIPPGVFMSHTLGVLKIYNLQVDLSLKQGSVITLNGLKVLYLGSVVFKKTQDLPLLLNGCRNLENLKLEDLHPWSSDENVQKVISGITNPFSQLNTVTITSVYVETLDMFSNVHTMTTEYLARMSIPFHKLTHMEFTLIGHSSIHLNTWLEFCPNLETLSFQVRKTINAFTGLSHRPVPPCVSSSLKYFAIRGFRGSGEMEFARYVLRNAASLKNFKIRCAPGKSTDIRLNWLQVLNLGVRLSTAPIDFQ